MELKLEQVKNYLRVDTTEDDELILSLLFTAKKLCLGILRVSSFSELGDEHDFDEFKIPEETYQVFYHPEGAAKPIYDLYVKAGAQGIHD